MQALKKAMKWDEETFRPGIRPRHLQYRRRVSDFNMGAMENKGLNIFNTAYVLASPKPRPTPISTDRIASSPTSISTTGPAIASPAVTGFSFL